jgi:type IV pilus assembly protein PilY1
MFTDLCKHAGLAALLTAVAGLSAPNVHAQVALAQKPLYLASPVIPNLIMAVDNSGSMDAETSLPTNDGALWWHTTDKSYIGRDRTDTLVGAGTLNFNNAGGANGTWKKFNYLFPNGSGGSNGRRVYSDGNNDHYAVAPIPAFAFVRSPRFNRAYFDPGVDYVPWLDHTGARLPNSDPEAARCDGHFPTTGTCTLDLTDNVEETGSNYTFRMFSGMSIPAGVKYRRRGLLNATGQGQATGCASDSSWQTSAVSFTNNGSNSNVCDVAISYFPATFYLPSTESLPASYGYKATAIVSSGVDPSGNTMNRYEIKLANFDSEAQYDAAIQNFANWFTYYRKRHLGTRAGITRAFADVEFLRVGYFRINNRDAVVMRDLTDTSTGGGRELFFDGVIGSPIGSGGTPNRESVAHMGTQFARTDSGAPILPEAEGGACQQNFGMLFTDGFSNASSVAGFGNVDGSDGAPFADTYSGTIADIAMHYYKTNPRPDLPAGQVPVSPACAAAPVDKRLDCEKNLHMNLFGITLGSRGIVFDDDNPIDPFVTPVTWPEPNLNRNPSAVDDLWHATINSRGRFINAKTPADIAAAIGEVLEAIANASRRSAGTAASGARRAVGFTAYVPEFDPNSWTGDVKAYTLLDTGGLGAVQWSAASKLPAPVDRKILVAQPNTDNTAFVSSELLVSNLPSGADFYTALGLDAAAFGSGGDYDGRTPADVVNFLRGDNTHEGSTAGKFRERLLRNPDGSTQHRVIGDILGSQPEVIDRGSEGHSLLPVAQGGRVKTDGSLAPANQAGTYSQFVSTTKATRTPVLIVGSNAGMIHTFNAGTASATASGKEVFAFLPNSVLNKQGLLLDREYEHTYMADGSPRIADACIGAAVGSSSCSWRTVAVTGMGSGGRSVVALDVTNPVASDYKFLWEFSAAHHADMGFVINRPRVFIGENGTWYAAFGNGLNSPNHKAKVYVVDLKTGEMVRTFDLGTAGDATDPNGGIAVAAVDGDGKTDQTTFDEEFNPYVDTLYANDFHGNLWKIDVSAKSPASWAVSFGGKPLFTAQAVDTAERSDKRQFMTGAIDVAFHPLRGNMVYVGTGRYLADGDQVVAATPQVQSFYAIWDDPLSPAPAEDEDAVITGRSTLQAQSITGTTTVGTVTKRVISELPVAYTGTGAKRGWYIDLYATGTGAFRNGERVLGEPRVEGGTVIFTAFQPVGTKCNPGGKNWLYALNSVTGANQLNIVGCTNCGATDLNPEGATAPPTLAPPIVVDPPRGDDIDSDGDGTPDTEEDPNCIPGTPGCRDLPSDGSPLPGRACLATLSVLLPNAGLSPFTQIPCGRQGWRQIQ